MRDFVTGVLVTVVSYLVWTHLKVNDSIDNIWNALQQMVQPEQKEGCVGFVQYNEADMDEEE